MNTNIIPGDYRDIDEAELKDRVAAVKKRLGSRLVILGHYYQQDAVAAFADIEGDSFSLAKAGSESDAKFIVFCGVHFMAEASVVLAKRHQRVFLPDMDAGCPMADMASIDEVETAWREIEDVGEAGGFLPITYMNSSAGLKAFCGRLGGAVCTSSSASRAFEWVIAQGRRIFFFPDENLGRNTALAFGIKEDETALWDPLESRGGLTEREIMGARLIVWKGYCHVHTHFTAGHVGEMRTAHPGCRIIVHPECRPDVVALADANGSTSFLKKFVDEAPSGATIIIGTEINLVSRLAHIHPDKKILPLARSLCPNMFKVSLGDLCWTLEKLGEVNEVFVDAGIVKDARIALERMLSI